MIRSKWFNELTTTELYEILRARAEIFVVEQNCVYQDLDGKDYESLHVFLEEEGCVVACLRAFMKDNKTAQMGRVLSLRHGEGYGAEILKAGIREIRKKMNPERIYIEAQCYAIGYYEREVEKTKFCGVNLLSPCTESNAALAHKRYVEQFPHMFTPMEPEEQVEHFRKHCEKIKTEKVVCYCKFCTDAINMGGKKGIHLLDRDRPGSAIYGSGPSLYKPSGPLQP